MRAVPQELQSRRKNNMVNCLAPIEAASFFFRLFLAGKKDIAESGNMDKVKSQAIALKKLFMV